MIRIIIIIKGQLLGLSIEKKRLTLAEEQDPLEGLAKIEQTTVLFDYPSSLVIISNNNYSAYYVDK